MHTQRWLIRSSMAGALGLVGILYVFSAEPTLPDQTAETDSRVTESVARDRAKIMHDVYAATLEVMHDRYFHDSRAIVPARALEDVFAELDRQSKIKARWISVNTEPMSIQHAPKSDFEKKAAAEIAAGKSEYELVEKDYYQRAAAIPLTGGCVSCHTQFFAGEPKSPRFAALVIGILIKEE